MTPTVCFPQGNIAPGGCVIKSTAIGPAALDEDGVYRLTGRARVFTSERDAIATIKGQLGEPIGPGDVVVLAGRGPLGTGMEETYQLTSALRYLPSAERSPLSRTRDSRASRPVRASATSVPRRSREGPWAAGRGRPDPGCCRPPAPGRIRRPRRARGREVGRGRGCGSARGAVGQRRRRAGSEAAGGHGAVVAPTVGVGWPVGRLRLRRRVDRTRALRRPGRSVEAPRIAPSRRGHRTRRGLGNHCWKDWWDGRPVRRRDDPAPADRDHRDPRARLNASLRVAEPAQRLLADVSPLSDSTRGIRNAIPSTSSTRPH